MSFNLAPALMLTREEIDRIDGDVHRQIKLVLRGEPGDLNMNAWPKCLNDGCDWRCCYRLGSRLCFLCSVRASANGESA
jgi:hypothetical protein